MPKAARGGGERHRPGNVSLHPHARTVTDPTRFSLNLLDTILKEARRDDMTFAECAGLYAGAKAVCTEFHTYIDERCQGDGYAHEKASQFEWHIGAALGFDVTNGHDKSMHIGWAAHSSLSNVLTPDQQGWTLWRTACPEVC